MTLLPALALVLSITSVSGGGDWPQFRGPDGNGVAPALELPREWSATQGVAWKVAIPGQGWAQPVVVGSTVYVATAVGAGLEPVLAMEAGIADPRTATAGTPPDVDIEYRLLALDLASGKERWSVEVAHGKPQFPIHPSNTWASETPVADAGGVVVFFGATGTLAAYDPSGKPQWKAELGAYPTLQGYGTASSPALHDGKVFVQCFNETKAFLACFDKASGKERWRVEQEAGTSWSSPLVWRNAKRTEVVCSGKVIASLEPSSGKELWRLAGIVGPSMCSIPCDEERIYLGQATFEVPPLYAIAAGGSGDLSPAAGSSDAKSQAWVQKAASPGFPTPVAAGGLLFVVKENLLACRDAATGELLYKERIPDFTAVVASPIVAGEELILLDEEGRAALIELGPELEVVGRGKLDDFFWSTPAVAGGSLLLRGLNGLYCVRK